MKRRQMGKVKRAQVVNTARKPGRNAAVKMRHVFYFTSWLLYKIITLVNAFRDMIEGSKRRKHKAEEGNQVVSGDNTKGN
jgi:hypothetical protein